jgi:hypothetical protein
MPSVWKFFKKFETSLINTEKWEWDNENKTRVCVWKKRDLLMCRNNLIAKRLKGAKNVIVFSYQKPNICEFCEIVFSLKNEFNQSRTVFNWYSSS